MSFTKFLFFILITFSCLTACIDDSEPTQTGSRLKVGDSLPPFHLKTTNGECINNDSLWGKRSLIVFFNTQCPDCRNELPSIDSLYIALKHQPDFRLICIAREENAESIEEYWRTHHFTMPVSAQTDRTIFNHFAYSGIPHIFISNHECLIQYIHNENDKPTFKQLLQEINETTRQQLNK